MLHLLFYVQPTPKTVEVDEPDGTSTLAGSKQRVRLVGVRLPTESAALQLIFVDSLLIHLHDALNLFVLFKLFFLVKRVLIFLHLHAVFVLNLLDCELDSTYFEDVSLLDVVLLERQRG